MLPTIRVASDLFRSMAKEGSELGSEDGSAEGSEEGSAEGSEDGSVDGSAEGSTEGSREGPAEGSADVSRRVSWLSGVHEEAIHPDKRIQRASVRRRTGAALIFVASIAVI